MEDEVTESSVIWRDQETERVTVERGSGVRMGVRPPQGSGSGEERTVTVGRNGSKSRTKGPSGTN